MFVAVLAAAVPARADQAVVVPATANIFGAGHAAPPAAPGGGAGTLPPFVAVSPGGVVTFSPVTGQVGCATGSATNGPDGGHACSSGTDISSVGGIAGIVDRQSAMFLVGVFLTAAEPRDPAPARLDFSTPPGGLGESFLALAPAVGEVFRIGDGLTGTGTGATQQFRAPAGATRLYLGFADGYAFHGRPGYYGDDSGTITAVVHAAGGRLAPPVLGRTADVTAVTGTVLVKAPGGSFVALGPTSQIPIGSILDTTRGGVTLTTAGRRPGTVQTGRFRSGVFALRQAPGERGLTELRLITNRQLCATRARLAGRPATTAAKKALPGRVLNLLRSSVRGRFRTRGRYSAATVRGTSWDTVDRCDGTLTRVHTGVVSVVDFRRRRTIVLRAGQSYLAPA